MVFVPTPMQRISMDKFSRELGDAGIEKDSPRWKQAMAICWAVETLRTGDGAFEAEVILNMTLKLAKGSVRP